MTESLYDKSNPAKGINSMNNQLYYGDNLGILRKYIQDESVDLIYLDPPFNSNRNYNILFKEESGKESQAQMVAFDDTWHWDYAAENAYAEIIRDAQPPVAKMIGAFRDFLGTNQMLAYLVMMTIRLMELHRVLKPTGSLYLHCDPTASHYLKIVLDMVFGSDNFRNEIVWKRQTAHSDARYKFCDVFDSILFYVKAHLAQFKPQYGEHDPEYIAKFYRFDDKDGRGIYRFDNITSPSTSPSLIYEWNGFAPPAKGWRFKRETMQKLYEDGRIWLPMKKDGTPDTTKRPRVKRYLKDMKGTIITNIWDDIFPLQYQAAERLGYPTQKPVALLERIIQASSNEGDVVLDPFAGCGTAIVAAEKLKRQWIGIDITHLAIALLKYRLKDSFELTEQDYQVIGEPKSIEDAYQLANDDRYQFQWWALSLVQARPRGNNPHIGKKGKDQGIDGIVNFMDDASRQPKQIIVQVKSGKVQARDIRDLVGTMEREKASMGFFITLEKPTKDMEKEASVAGFYESPGWKKQYPKLQIFTISDLIVDGKQPNIPPNLATFKKAKPQDQQQDQRELWKNE